MTTDATPNGATGLVVRGGSRPWLFAILYFPYGLTFGFPAVALGFLGRRAGVPVSVIAGVVGMTFLAAGWKFVWAPLGDYTLSRKRWYVVAIALISIGLLAMTALPFTAASAPVIALFVLTTSLAATFVAFATEGLLVHNTPLEARGRAAGWFQSGNQLAQTAGGGMGLWLMQHLPTPWMAGAVLSALIAACALALFGLEEPPRHAQVRTVRDSVGDVGRNLAQLIRLRGARIGLLLAILPIGTAATQYLFGSLGSEWHASGDVVSIVLGIGGGIAIVAGCFAGGWAADRMSKPLAYALACALQLLACTLMAILPRTPETFAVTTLLYTFTTGLVASSFTSLILAVVGHSAPATKINLYFALNTLFSLGVLRLIGGAHDRWGTNGMLYAEVSIGVAALVVFWVLSQRLGGVETAGS